MRRLPLSLLVEKFRQQGDAALGSSAWLVREPSTWQPPDPAANITQPLQPELSLRPAGESLAFELALESGQTAIRVGRAESCELTLSDGTLSKQHLVLEPAADGTWWVQDHGSSNGTFLDEVKLPPHAPAALHDGARLKAGHLEFTFQDAAGMIARVRAASARETLRAAIA